MSSVLVVEDHQEVRSRICTAINLDTDLSVYAEASSTADAMAALENDLPDVALVDLGLPDKDGDTIISWLSANAPKVESLVLTVFGDERHVVSAIQSGASGYLLKCDAVEDICSSIKQVLRCQSPISPAVARHILNLTRKDAYPAEGPERTCNTNTPKLTPTEIEVLKYIAKGFTAPEIADLTGKSRSTVPVHIRNIYKKLSVHGRGEAVFQAIQLGIIDSTQTA